MAAAHQQQALWHQQLKAQAKHHDIWHRWRGGVTKRKYESSHQLA